MSPTPTSRWLPTVLALLIVAFWAPDGAAAQVTPQDSAPDAARERGQTAAPAADRIQAQGQPDPGIFEVAARARILADSASRAERNIDRLRATAALETELDEAAQRQLELQALLSSMVEMEFVRLERLSRLRDQALLEDNRLEAINGRIIDRLTELGQLRGRWTERQRDWRDWRRRLGEDPGFAAVANDVDAAIARAEAVVLATSDAATGLLALQRRGEELRGEIEQIGSVVSAIRTGRRSALLDRGEPALLFAAHRQQLAEEGLRGWHPVQAFEPAAYPAFVRGHLGFLMFHVLLALAIGFVARRLRRTSDGTAWQGLLDHPWMLGVLGSVAVATQRIALAPPLWDVLLWVLFGATAAVISRRLFEARALRWTIYLLAIFYPVFLLLEVIQLPVPVFRILLAVVAAAAVPTFLLLGRRTTAAAAAEGHSGPLRTLPLRIGAGLWAAVLLATAAGYDALGRWMLHSTVTSGAVALLVVLVFALIRGGTIALLSRPDTGRRLRGVGVQLAQRFMGLVRVVVAVLAVFLLLDIWTIAESPIFTWQRIIGAGITIGPLEITVGRAIVAVLLLYGAVLVSMLVRTLVRADVERRQAGDRGLSESISRLVHYAVITVGVVFALGAIGVELQNFAIVAGALGIGVGFGLQNVVSNFAAGLILLFERPVRVGDTVVVDDVWGTIQKIGLRSTVMVTFDQSEMIVPNADLVSEKVTNWTLSNPTARIILPVGVAYGSPIQRVLQILIDAGTEDDEVLKEPPPEALFVGFGDSSLDFELRVWVTNIRRRLQVRSNVLTEVERRLTDADIEIPFPQRDLHLRSVDTEALGRLK
jgi:potassium-dependent mechanosensitive channel